MRRRRRWRVSPSGRKWLEFDLHFRTSDDYAPSTPEDSRVHLPKSERSFVDTVLPDGITVLTDWTDAPLTELGGTAEELVSTPPLLPVPPSGPVSRLPSVPSASDGWQTVLDREARP